MMIAGVVFSIMGGLMYMTAASAIHEIEAFLLFLIAAVFFVGANIVAAIEAGRRSAATLSTAETSPKTAEGPWPKQ